MGNSNRKIPVLPMFADSFRAPGLRATLRHKLLAMLLNDPAIQIVSNHNLAASLDLKRIGVNQKNRTVRLAINYIAARLRTKIRAVEQPTLQIIICGQCYRDERGR